MHRYFMTIPEAVHLVLQAAAMGAGGEVFMLNMGQQVRILDLAEDLLGHDAAGNIKPRNEWLHAVNWDLVVFD